MSDSTGEGARPKLRLVGQQERDWRELLVGVSAPSQGCWLEGSRAQDTAAAAGLTSAWAPSINTAVWHWVFIAWPQALGLCLLVVAVDPGRAL